MLPEDDDIEDNYSEVSDPVDTGFSNQFKVGAQAPNLKKESDSEAEEVEDDNESANEVSSMEEELPIKQVKSKSSLHKSSHMQSHQASKVEDVDYSEPEDDVDASGYEESIAESRHSKKPSESNASLVDDYSVHEEESSVKQSKRSGKQQKSVAEEISDDAEEGEYKQDSEDEYF